GEGLRLLPGAARAPGPARRAALGRPAADARDQPRADEPAATAAARRALARAVAPAGEGDLHDHPAAQRGGRRRDPARRAERAHGARDGPVRLCARSGEGGDARHERRTGRLAEGARILSGSSWAGWSWGALTWTAPPAS